MLSTPASPDDGFDLRGQFARLWDARYLLAGLALLLGLLGGVMSLLADRQDQGSATLSVSASKLENRRRPRR